MDKSRLARLIENLEMPLLLGKRESLFYLTGRSFVSGYLLVKPRTGADRKQTGAEVVYLGDGLEQAQGLPQDQLKNLNKYFRPGSRVGVDESVSLRELETIEKLAPRVHFQPAPDPVERLRVIKDSAELRAMRESMRIVAGVFQRVKKALKTTSWTEQALARFIRVEGFRAGADEVSFDPIVAAGSNAAIPHHSPTSRKLKPGETIILDFGFSAGGGSAFGRKLHGYCSDFTRTVFLKRAPKRLAEIYNQVERAYWGAIKHIDSSLRAERSNLALGSPRRSAPRDDRLFAREVHKAAVSILAEKHFDRYFIHNLGHGCGLEVHEAPSLSPKSKDILLPGMVFSIEPGVYIRGVGGVRIEDLVYLDGGKAKKFISVPTELKANII